MTNENYFLSIQTDARCQNIFRSAIEAKPPIKN